MGDLFTCFGAVFFREYFAVGKTGLADAKDFCLAWEIKTARFVGVAYDT